MVSKGVGRFTWLKFFESATVTSVYQDQKKNHKRDFEFNLNGVEDGTPSEVTSHQGTTITLSPLRIEFEKKTKKTHEEVSIAILEHFIAFYVTKAIPEITIKDGAASIKLDDFFDQSIGKSTHSTKFKIGNTEFKTTSIKTYLGHSKNSLFLCGNKRVADKASLGSIDKVFSKRFYDQDLKSYAYDIFVESEFLDEHVNDDRDGFRFPESSISNSSPITRDLILREGVSVALEEMKEEIKKIRAGNKKTVENFVYGSAPQYRYLLKEHEEQISKIHETDPIAIDQSLRRIQFEEEVETKNTIAALMKSAENVSENVKEEWQEKSKEILSKLTETGKANLAGYIVQRKMILELLKKRLELDGANFVKEEAIHELIFPMRSTSDEVSYEDQNLWIIDERLSYHYYLASDKALSQTPPAKTSSRKEPDIIVFNRPIALNDRAETERPESIVILEFKRPGESPVNGEKNPVDQILEYVELISEGKAENRKGRKIEAPSGVYFFGYVICEIDAQLKKVLSRKTMRETPDERGMFGYFPDHKTYIEVISYDKMLDDALKRNRILFEKLQIPPGSK